MNSSIPRRLRFLKSNIAAVRFLFKPAVLLWFSLLTTVAASQTTTYPDQEIQVPDLPVITAKTHHADDALRAALEIIVHDEEICCGRDSALGDSLDRADPRSLKDIASKLQGRQLRGDGRPISVTVEYLPPDQVYASHLVAMMQAGHAPLMLWNSHIYVVSGLSYAESVDYSDYGVMYITHKFMLVDPRFSDSRRTVVFDRLTDDVKQVQGLLFLDWKSN